jgi:hypothetical protein
MRSEGEPRKRCGSKHLKKLYLRGREVSNLLRKRKIRVRERKRERVRSRKRRRRKND